MEQRAARLGGAIAAAAGAVVAVLALAAPASAAPRECFLIEGCTSVVGAWVVIPAVDQPIVPAGATVQCPDSADGSLQLPVGSDYERSGGAAPPPDVTRYLPGPGIGLINGATAFFFAINRSATAASFRPRIGCVPQPGGAAAAQDPSGGTRVRTRELELGPSRTVRATHRCRRGERLVRGTAGVLFHRDRPPTARELRDVDVRHHHGKTRVRARVRTGATVGDRERVTLQVHAVCRR